MSERLEALAEAYETGESFKFFMETFQGVSPEGKHYLELGRWLRCLLDRDYRTPRGVAADEIRRWLREHARENAKGGQGAWMVTAGLKPEFRVVEAADLENWEAEILNLTLRFAMYRDLETDPWETMVAAERKAYAADFKNHADSLVRMLERSERKRPHLPLLTMLLDDDITMHWAELMQCDTMGPICDVRHRLANKAEKGQHQEIANVIRTLSTYIQDVVELDRREDRPNFGDANTRAFVRYIAKTLIKISPEQIPRKIIGACAAVRFDQSPPPPAALSNWLSNQFQPSPRPESIT